MPLTENLTDVELLALLIPEPQARSLLDRYGSLPTLAAIPFDELLTIPGMTKARAMRLMAAFAVGRRITGLRIADRPIIHRPSEAIALVDLNHMLQEHLQVIMLDAHNRALDIETVYIGSLNATLVRVAEIFRKPIARNAAGIIVIHNHPSGDATPSAEDIAFTEDLVAAGKLLDIAVLDHLIVGDGEWVSLRERRVGF